MMTLWVYYRINVVYRNLADIDGDGKMNQHEFSVAIHLIRKRLQGVALPKVLPDSLKVPPVTTQSPPPHSRLRRSRLRRSRLQHIHLMFLHLQQNLILSVLRLPRLLFLQYPHHQLHRELLLLYLRQMLLQQWCLPPGNLQRRLQLSFLHRIVRVNFCKEDNLRLSLFFVEGLYHSGYSW
jgi:hypothetical protein